ncbi:hypothetical protein FB567DRAFT_554614 [Paraphoma chrysanthemicola]|uniref:Uncharacterized protein n=1 Tax=Paraphoma chrysanthemicola TaxID=798071 RepID=A0A8K0VT43_9PLEO|nr:hypothetical protein FB567DRAFT_554614 [Paraphoma chrysanthemicola]
MPPASKSPADAWPKKLSKTRLARKDVTEIPDGVHNGKSTGQPNPLVQDTTLSRMLPENIWEGKIDNIHIEWSEEARNTFRTGSSNSLVLWSDIKRKAVTEHICVNVISKLGLTYAKILASPHHTRTVQDSLTGRWVKVPDDHHITVTSDKYLNSGYWSSRWQAYPTWHIYLKPEGRHGIVVVGLSCAVRLSNDVDAKPVIDERYSCGRYTPLC